MRWRVPVLVHEAQVGIGTLSVLLGDLQTLGDTAGGRSSRLVIGQDESLVSPVAI